MKNIKPQCKDCLGNNITLETNTNIEDNTTQISNLETGLCSDCNRYTNLIWTIN